jgi:hypothetical protein
VVRWIWRSGRDAESAADNDAGSMLFATKVCINRIDQDGVAGGARWEQSNRESMSDDVDEEKLEEIEFGDGLLLAG